MAPWIVAARPVKAEGFWASEGDADNVKEWEERKEVLEAAGAKVIVIEQPALRTLLCLLFSMTVLAAHDITTSRSGSALD